MLGVGAYVTVMKAFLEFFEFEEELLDSREAATENTDNVILKIVSIITKYSPIDQ
jgi:hypothetical protein